MEEGFLVFRGRLEEKKGEKSLGFLRKSLCTVQRHWHTVDLRRKVKKAFITSLLPSFRRLPAFAFRRYVSYLVSLLIKLRAVGDCGAE